MPERAYKSSSNESVRMFKSDFVDFFSRVHPATPLVLYLPLIMASLYFALHQSQLSILSVVLWFGLGFAIWTLLEYVIHRYPFHYDPKTRIVKQFHFVVHGVHHDYPNDAKRLVMPPAVSIPLAIIFYGLFIFLFGRTAPAIWAGFAGGYVFYDSIHYEILHFPIIKRFLHRLKHAALRHHY